MLWLSLGHFLISLTFFLIILLRFLNISISKYYTITRKYIPKYKELISEHQAIYPCVMDKVMTMNSSLHQNKWISSLNSCIFIKDQSFIIANSSDANIYLEIPFSSITYHDSRISGSYGSKYGFYIRLVIYGVHEIESFSFRTLKYHHKIDRLIHKRYPNLLNDENLYDFICENFPNEEEYERQRNLERNNRSNKIFETSVFHKFTNIDAE